MSYIYDLTDTWNNVATTFTAIKMNVTDTASAAGSLLIDLQVGGSSRFNVRKDGGVTIGNTFFTVNSAAGIGYNGSGTISVAATGNFSFGSSGLNAPDLFLTRDAANTLAQRNSTNAQAFRVYNTFTDASNYERGELSWSANNFTVGTTQAGTGLQRRLTLSGAGDIVLSTGNTQRWNIAGAGHFLAAADNTYDIGASGANRPRNVYVAGSVTAGSSFECGSGDSFVITSRAIIRSFANGTIQISNAASNDFNRLQFGGTTSSFPSLKRNATAINVRLADDSADAPLTASNLTLAMTTAGTSLDITNSDPGNLGVAIQTRHTSASPAVDDYVGYWNIRGNDSLGNNTLYGWFQCLIVDPTDGSEKGQMYIGAGGGSQLQIGQGVHTSGATAPGDVNVIAARQIKTQARTVAQLPAAGTVGAGTRGWVSDSNVAFSTAVITNIVAGGGANGCPVYSDGTNWRIG